MGALLDLDGDAFGIEAITDTLIIYSKSVYPSTAPTAITDTCIAYFVQASNSETDPDEPVIVVEPSIQVVDCV